jgi:hypothetical protein
MSPSTVIRHRPDYAITARTRSTATLGHEVDIDGRGAMPFAKARKIELVCKSARSEPCRSW